MKDRKTKQMTIRLSQSLYDRVRAKADREDISLGQIVRRYLRAWIAEDEQPEEKPEKTSS